MEPTVEITKELLEELDEPYNGVEFQTIKTLEMVANTANGNTSQLIVTPAGSDRRIELMMPEDPSKFLQTFLGIPANATNVLDDPDLARRYWNHFFTKKSDALNGLKVVSKDGNVLNFTMDSFQSLKPSQVINAVRANMDGAVFERAPRVWKNNLEFEVTSPALYQDFLRSIEEGNLMQVVNTSVITGDVHHFSVATTYNFGGGDSPSMKVQGHRHSCGNRMNVDFGVGGNQWRVFTTAPEEALRKFTDFAQKGMEHIRMVLIPHVKATMAARLSGDPVSDMTEMMNDAGIPTRTQELVVESYRAENLGGTLYHAVNAFTRAANLDRCPPDMVKKLRNLAGTLTVRHDPSKPDVRCDHCHQAIRERRAQQAMAAARAANEASTTTA